MEVEEDIFGANEMRMAETGRRLGILGAACALGFILGWSADVLAEVHAAPGPAHQTQLRSQARGMDLSRLLQTQPGATFYNNDPYAGLGDTRNVLWLRRAEVAS